MFTRKKSLMFFLLPGLLGLMLFYLIPFMGGIYFSMTDGSIANNFIWFDNYKRVWSNPVFLLGLKNSLELSLISAPLIFLFSFVLSVVLRSLQERSLGFRNLLLLFDFGGPINRLMEAVGLQRVLWLESEAMRVPVVLLYIWKNVGFSVVIFSAALNSVPDELYEFARLEGAGPLKQATKITLPLIMPTAFLVFVLAWVNAFKIFKEVYFIGGAYPRDSVYTLQHYMNNLFAKLDYQLVTTAAYSFAVIVFVLFGVLYMGRAVRGHDR